LAPTWAVAAADDAAVASIIPHQRQTTSSRTSSQLQSATDENRPIVVKRLGYISQATKFSRRADFYDISQQTQKRAVAVLFFE